MGAETKLTGHMNSRRSRPMMGHLPAIPVLDALAWRAPRTFFYQRSPRARVVLSQLPLPVTLLPVLGIAGAYHPELFREPVFVWGIVLHAVMFSLCCALPWHRLPAGAVLAIPVLDFVSIGLIRESVQVMMPAAGALAIFPVLWLARSAIFPRLCMAMTFIGPLLMVWIPLLLAGSTSAESFAGVILLPLIMGAIGLGIRIMSASLFDQRRSLEDARDLLKDSLADSARKERLLHTPWSRPWVWV